MLQKWHEVVARLDENPKELLAAAFLRHDDHWTPKEILGNDTLNEDEVRNYKPAKETKKQIQKINFAEEEKRNIHITINQGDNSQQTPFNMNQGVGHRQALPCGGSAAGYGHTTIYSRNADNMCRGEGVGDEMGGKNSSLYKKTKDDTLTEDVVNILREYMKSVGWLKTPSMSGTAFRVGNRYVITASHVLEEIPDQMYGESRPTNDPSHTVPAVFINFNGDPNIPPKTLYALKPPCFLDTDLDVAILEISNPDDFLPRGLPLSKSDGPKSSVSCIGYGHPGSSVKHLDPTCFVSTVNSDRVRQCINTFHENIQMIELGLKINAKDPKRVNEAFTGYDNPSCFLQDSYFEHGGSGGPAIDHSNPHSPNVAGIYTRGFPSVYFDLPVYMRLKYKKEYRFEMCTKTSSLYSLLVLQNEELARNIFG